MGLSDKVHWLPNTFICLYIYALFSEEVVLGGGLRGDADLAAEETVVEGDVLGILETDGILALADVDIAERDMAHGLLGGALQDKGGLTDLAAFQAIDLQVVNL